MPRRKPDADRPVTSEDVEASLAREIWKFAEVWKRCPKKGCRRAGECLRLDDCAGVSHEPYWPSEEDQRLYFRPLLDAIRAMQGGHALYDPDRRDRERPMPPAPKRIAPPARPSESEPPAPGHDPGSASRDRS
jgi:hypothetical protein